MDSTQKLIELFKQFPGIGPRQAKRFVYFLLTRPNGYTKELGKMISEIKSHVNLCQECYRFFAINGLAQLYQPDGLVQQQPDGLVQQICPICQDQKRDRKVLMIVSHDVDFENIEKTSSYNGLYFVLGGNIPILDKNPEQRIRQSELLQKVSRMTLDTKDTLAEIIIALNYNPEGENTLTYLHHILEPLIKGRGTLIPEGGKVKLSTLGRGLSTGTELEYSDSDTIKNALKNRQ